MKILVTCPPMLRQIDEFRERIAAAGHELITPQVSQTLPEEELVKLVPQVDGWIIGDDPVTRRVLTAGTSGRLKAAVKWGVGVDNIDFGAATDLKLTIPNTPGMFGGEVADVAVGYVICLARHLMEIDRGVRAGLWPKPSGISLREKTVALPGLGDIGRHVAKRLMAMEMRVIGYDPFVREELVPSGVERAIWPERVGEADFIVLTSALTASSRHMLNESTLASAKRGVRVVNVARGPLIDESALVRALQSGRVSAAALDVMEIEPLPTDSPLRAFEQCIFGSHNGSNTIDAVRRTSTLAIDLLLRAFDSNGR